MKVTREKFMKEKDFRKLLKCTKVIMKLSNNLDLNNQ